MSTRILGYVHRCGRSILVWLDSERQLEAIRDASLMAELMQADVFILDDLTIACRPSKYDLKRVLEVVRYPDKEE
jgi:hypothetical protein